MTTSKYLRSFRPLALILTLVLLTLPLVAQEAEEQPPNLKFKFEPDSLHLEVGDSVSITVHLLTEDDQIHKMPFFVFGSGRQARRSIEVKPRRSGPDGTLTAKVYAHRPGSFRLSARSASIRREDRVSGHIPAEVAFPPLKEIVFIEPIDQAYSGTDVPFRTKVFDEADLERKGLDVGLRSSNPDVASFDRFGNLLAHKKGRITVIAEVEGLQSKTDVRILDNPVASVELASRMAEARTGDVVQFKATARDGLGRAVDDAPIYYSFSGKPLEEKGAAPAGEVDKSGRFVAETPGYYTVVAQSGPFVSKQTVRITPRNLNQEFELVGHGEVLDVFTSDLWVFEGVDGRDYAITGTWGANGDAYFWDVTDPANMKTIDTVRVDARTVNDVKVSEDARVAVISREGASNRKNGIVILDISNPADVKILSQFDEQLTGGVHNVFIYDNHVYAVNNGVRYDVINIEDPTKPYRVSRFELNTPGHGVHDVWIEDGVAYSSNWQDGLQLVDIGGVTSRSPFRKFGQGVTPEILNPQLVAGSPANPFRFASYEYPSGWNHAAFPYYNEKTKKFYVVAGDETFPYGLDVQQKTPTIAGGWLHFVDFTNPLDPKEVARYEVPEAGSHNLWIEDDILYAAFYNGGVRAVDVSGDLMGDLYKQGREIDWFRPMHKQGVVANAPMVWGPQPYKGRLFLTDMNSGLWALRLIEKKERRRGM